MQATQEAYFPDLATVLRPNNASNIAGGRTKSTTPVYTNLPCQVSERVLRQLTEVLVGGRLESGIRWIVVLPINTLVGGVSTPIVISNDDQIVVTEYRSGKTMTLEVNGVQVTESWETAMTVECQLIR
jgi:hypothetical protein